MVLTYFFKGILIGFSIAAPVGPIGILTVHRSLYAGALAGLATGMGAATADAVYGCVAAFGLTFVSGFLISWNAWLLRAGSLFLIILGIGFLIRPPKPTRKRISQGGTTCFGAYVSSFFLTMTNPMTIVAFTAIFAGLGLGTATGTDYVSAGGLVLGVFLGSSLWWVTLAVGAGRLGRQMGETIMTPSQSNTTADNLCASTFRRLYTW
jgi:threonine/homoserine/homoserine lactone efflux protein